MFCRSFCASIMGVKALLVKVEADVTEGLPGIPYGRISRFGSKGSRRQSKKFS